MNIQVRDTAHLEERRGRFLFDGYVTPYRDVVTVTEKAVTVDGVPWTAKQTAQAVRDARFCRCGGCACCQIRAAVYGGVQ